VALAIGRQLSGQIMLLYGGISTQMIDTGTPFPLRLTPSFAPNSAALFNSPRTMAEHVLDGCLQSDRYSVGCGCRTSAFAGDKGGRRFSIGAATSAIIEYPGMSAYTIKVSGML
jgi:hypothetical protein